jgi:hypothetical protein
MQEALEFKCPAQQDQSFVSKLVEKCDGRETYHISTAKSFVGVEENLVQPCNFFNANLAF